MNSQLIPVFNGDISNEAALLCDARELHRHLEVGKRFASWIKERIAEYGFVENQDYILISQIRETKTGRGGDRRSKDYHLTLDTAKELAMVERNDKGRQVRRYFIDCEKRIHNQVAVTSHQKPAPLHQPTYVSCRVLHTYNETGVIVSSQLARGDEMLTSPTGFIELMMRRQGL
jgi:anti-repressor protein